MHQMECGKKETPFGAVQNVTHPGRRVGYYLLNRCHDGVTVLISALLESSFYLTSSVTL